MQHFRRSEVISPRGNNTSTGRVSRQSARPVCCKDRAGDHWPGLLAPPRWWNNPITRSRRTHGSWDQFGSVMHPLYTFPINLWIINWMSNTSRHEKERNVRCTLSLRKMKEMMLRKQALSGLLIMINNSRRILVCFSQRPECVTTKSWWLIEGSLVYCFIV